jgi:hypothetical protein
VLGEVRDAAAAMTGGRRSLLSSYSRSGEIRHDQNALSVGLSARVVELVGVAVKSRGRPESWEDEGQSSLSEASKAPSADTRTGCITPTHQTYHTTGTLGDEKEPG